MVILYIKCSNRYMLNDVLNDVLNGNTYSSKQVSKRLVNCVLYG